MAATSQLAFDHSCIPNEQEANQIEFVGLGERLFYIDLTSQATSSTSRCTTKETVANTEPIA